ncbi:hypothetical protein BCR32DRAFT_330089 [Anaeromyces robustus]|uniref:Transmembrane protein n=1 Tax=Anaeromyces robustus TaxID=1754192 RepID=A0A1Y1WEB7_9FUNG|nr:hypothetical protein BCR32DRAFT_330089 [Anaeromyces robustus]|eukprot:ORX71678.1 hypothetical protein BCR32DRAFT_330089 [Anaeromyces robustus]
MNIIQIIIQKIIFYLIVDLIPESFLNIIHVHVHVHIIIIIQELILLQNLIYLLIQLHIYSNNINQPILKENIEKLRKRMKRKIILNLYLLHIVIMINPKSHLY